MGIKKRLARRGADELRGKLESDRARVLEWLQEGDGGERLQAVQELLNMLQRMEQRFNDIDDDVQQVIDDKRETLEEAKRNKQYRDENADKLAGVARYLYGNALDRLDREVND